MRKIDPLKDKAIIEDNLKVESGGAEALSPVESTNGSR